jgi:chromosomal replication initiator protein
VSRRLLVSDIQRVVAEHYGISPETMREADGPFGSRVRDRSRPRQVAMLLSTRLTRHSLNRIGDLFGGRDHSTIIYGVRKIEQLIVEDQAVRNTVKTLENELVSTDGDSIVDEREKVSFVSFSASA